MTRNSKVDQRNLWLFFILAFVWTWLCQLPRVLSSAGFFELPGFLFSVLGYVAMFGPAVAAFALTSANEGREGVTRLWKRGWECGFEKRWLLPILLLMPALAGLTALLMRTVGVALPGEYSLSPAMVVPVMLLIFLLNSLPEEFGWRGYALDRLQERWGALTSSLILGLLWGVWHLPLHFITGTTQQAIPVWQFIIQSVLLAVLYTWLHNNTGGSVLVAALFHTVSNISGAVVPYWTSSEGRWLSFGLLLIVATVVALVWGPDTLVRGQKARVSRLAGAAQAPQSFERRDE